MILLKPNFYKIKFVDTVAEFPEMLRALTSSKKYSIKDYFTSYGVDGICEQLEIEKDFEGLYIFFKNEKPFYTGISKKVIRRINQHVKGKNHYSSSLCYKMGAALHKSINKESHLGGRGGLDFVKYVEPAKKELMKCQFAFIKIPNDVKLYLFEVYVAMELGTLHYNSFCTH
jgi:hypothetical protein